jgi:hypothetical protein
MSLDVSVVNNSLPARIRPVQRISVFILSCLLLTIFLLFLVEYMAFSATSLGDVWTSCHKLYNSINLYHNNIGLFLGVNEISNY